MRPEFAPMIVLSPSTLDRLGSEAAGTPRRRLNLNLHTSHAEACQRFLNAMEPDSYLRPHRQLLDPKRKLLVGIRGRFALIVFDDAGGVSQVVPFAACIPGENVGVDVPAGQWNTVLSLESGSVLLEVKEGPFDPDAPREFAPWAPVEGAPEVHAYVDGLRAML